MNIKELIKNKAEIIKLKKAQLKKGDIISFDTKAQITTKADANTPDTDSEIHRTIVGNTYGFMDSHDDVHFKGIFSKSIKENGTKVLHLHDHVHELAAKVGTPLEVYEKEVSWADVGLKTGGMTTALLMDTRIEKERNPNIFKDYLNGSINQHSVGMQYVKIDLAVNDPEEEEEYATWNKYKDEVINIEKAEEQGFFWAVTEAKLIEISCVIAGSNELTPTLESKTYDFEALNELSEEVKINPTKENFLHFCNQYKALQEGEAVVKTLPEVEKPQKLSNFYLSQF